MTIKVLDDILPEFKRHDRLDDEEALHQVNYSSKHAAAVDKC